MIVGDRLFLADRSDNRWLIGCRRRYRIRQRRYTCFLENVSACALGHKKGILKETSSNQTTEQCVFGVH